MSKEEGKLYSFTKAENRTIYIDFIITVIIVIVVVIINNNINLFKIIICHRDLRVTASLKAL